MSIAPCLEAKHSLISEFLFYYKARLLLSMLLFHPGVLLRNLNPTCAGNRHSLKVFLNSRVLVAIVTVKVIISWFVDIVDKSSPHARPEYVDLFDKATPHSFALSRNVVLRTLTVSRGDPPKQKWRQANSCFDTNNATQNKCWSASRDASQNNTIGAQKCLRSMPTKKSIQCHLSRNFHSHDITHSYPICAIAFFIHAVHWCFYLY